MSGTPTLAIVIPCYNEEEVLPETRRRIVGLIRGLVEASKISPDSAVTGSGKLTRPAP